MAARCAICATCACAFLPLRRLAYRNATFSSATRSASCSSRCSADFDFRLMKVALLTGGKDVHYVRGLLPELVARDIHVDLIGGEELVDCKDASTGYVVFHNFVGDQAPGCGLLTKAWRVLGYYIRLVVFAARTDT